MTTPPHLVETDGTYRLDAPARRGGRTRFALSDRAESLLVDDLGYGNRDVIPTLTVRVLGLAGGLYRRDDRTDPLDLSWTQTDGVDDAAPPSEELAALADYLEAVEVDRTVVDAVTELVRTTPLSAHTSPDAIASTGDRTTGLRDIARDL